MSQLIQLVKPSRLVIVVANQDIMPHPASTKNCMKQMWKGRSSLESLL